MIWPIPWVNMGLIHHVLWLLFPCNLFFDWYNSVISCPFPSVVVGTFCNISLRLMYNIFVTDKKSEVRGDHMHMYMCDVQPMHQVGLMSITRLKSG